MSPPMTAGIVLSTVALLVQGTRCLLRQGAPPFVRRFGALTLLLAGLSAVFSCSSTSGRPS